MDQSGSAFLIHESRPVRILGTIGSAVNERGGGRCYGAFFQEPGFLEMKESGGEFRLFMSRTVAMAWIANVTVSLEQIGELRSLLGLSSPDRSKEAVETDKRSSVLVEVEREHLTCSWNADADLSILEPAEGNQVLLNLSEGLARKILQSIVSSVARFSMSATSRYLKESKEER